MFHPDKVLEHNDKIFPFSIIKIHLSTNAQALLNTII